jgi:transposase-like protein
MRKKAHILIIVFAILFLPLNVYTNLISSIIKAILIIFFGFMIIRIKCPLCKKSLIFNPILVFDVEWWIPTLYCPKKCSECGYDFMNW